MKRFGVLLAVNLASILLALFLIGNENSILRLASAPFVMISIFCMVWLVQNMGKRPDVIERKLLEEAEKRERARHESEDLSSV